jgi:hypothetical protein
MNASRYIHPVDIEEDTRTETDSEEEDEEIIMLIFPALYAASSRAKTPCHTLSNASKFAFFQNSKIYWPSKYSYIASLIISLQH